MGDDEAFDALIDALAEPKSRQQGSGRLAPALGCEEVLLLVLDSETRVFLPAPGMPKTLRGGPQWRRFLAKCIVPGQHQADVDLPASSLKTAWGVSTGTSLAVALGGSPDASGMSLLARRMPLLGALLTSQQRQRQQQAEVQLALEGAARAHALASALDAARSAASELNAKLGEETQRKDEFLAMLAHELRNPLAPLVSSVALLGRAEMPDPKLVSRVVDVMSRQLSQLTRLVDDLLDVSRVSRGAIKLQREPLALGEILQAAVETAAPLVEAKRHQLLVRGSDRPVHVTGDRARLIQVFANLLSNAAKYTDSGGSITVDVFDDSGRASVTVKDNGVGIPPEMLGSIFDLFSQVQATLHRSQGGLGIGLTLARTLVELHGGSLTAHSAGPGRGSSFVVSLPVSRVAPQRPQALPTAGKFGAGIRRPRVLLVEDNADGAATMRELLLHMDAEVQVARSGEEALATAQAFAPELILMDIGLPGMSGYEAASRLRLMLGARPKLVALTGYGSPEDRARAREAGFDEHLVKPASPDALQRLLKRAQPGGA